MIDKASELLYNEIRNISRRGVMKRLIAAFLSIAFLLGASACVKGESKIKKITSFEKITLTVSGMRMGEGYELVRTDDGYTLSQYSGFFNMDDEDSKEENLINRVTLGQQEYQKMIELLNECNFGSWNGFDRANRHVLDGEMFTLKATVNGSQRIYASGSNAFPKHYREFYSALTEMLS